MPTTTPSIALSVRMCSAQSMHSAVNEVGRTVSQVDRCPGAICWSTAFIWPYTAVPPEVCEQCKHVTSLSYNAGDCNPVRDGCQMCASGNAEILILAGLTRPFGSPCAAVLGRLPPPRVVARLRSEADRLRASQGGAPMLGSSRPRPHLRTGTTYLGRLPLPKLSATIIPGARRSLPLAEGGAPCSSKRSWIFAATRCAPLALF